MNDHGCSSKFCLQKQLIGCGPTTPILKDNSRPHDLMSFLTNISHYHFSLLDLCFYYLYQWNGSCMLPYCSLGPGTMTSMLDSKYQMVPWIDLDQVGKGLPKWGSMSPNKDIKKRRLKYCIVQSNMWCLSCQ